MASSPALLQRSRSEPALPPPAPSLSGPLIPPPSPALRAQSGDLSQLRSCLQSPQHQSKRCPFPIVDTRHLDRKVWVDINVSLGGPMGCTPTVEFDICPLVASLRLHSAVWENSCTDLLGYLSEEKFDIDTQDSHGNTALLLAITLGRRECVSLLLEYGASITVRNVLGWSAMSEAISYGNRDILRDVWYTVTERATIIGNAHTAYILEKMQAIDDLHVSLEWKFFSWVPFVSRFCPQDTVRLYKHSTPYALYIRMDNTLIGMDGITWQRGDISYVMILVHTGAKVLFALDHGAQTYCFLNQEDDETEAQKKQQEHTQHARHQQSMSSSQRRRARAALREREQQEKMAMIEAELDEMLKKEITAASLPGDTQFERTKMGWWGFQQPAVQRIAEHNTRVYVATNVDVHTRKRSEHLSVEDRERLRRRQAALHKRLTSPVQEEEEEGHSGLISHPRPEGNDQYGEEEEEEEEEEEDEEEEEAGAGVRMRGSLPPPPQPTISFDEYLTLETQDSHMGRPLILSTERRSFKAKLFMCDDFPLDVATVVAMLEVVAPRNAAIAKLRTLLTRTLPAGFPLRIELPVFPTISGQVTFTDFDGEACLSRRQFEIPVHYKRVPLFPFLQQ